MMKGQKGVTLVALVITVIVLLILAGVALATISGNNSVIDNANYAVTQYKQDAYNDQNIINGVDNLFKKYLGSNYQSAS